MPVIIGYYTLLIIIVVNPTTILSRPRRPLSISISNGLITVPSYRQSLMYDLLLSRNSVIIQLVFPYNCFVHSLLTLSINTNKEATKLGIPSGHIYIETFSIQRTPNGQSEQYSRFS